MNPLALELPEDKTLWATWLDHQVVGPELRLLVRQWELLSNNISEPPSGESWDDRLVALYSEQLPEILARGLSALPTDDLLTLIRQPRLLLALQEQVFIGGGPYWENLARPDSHLEATARCKSRVLEAIGAQASSESPGAESTRPPATVTPATPIAVPRASRHFSRSLVYLAAMAASILIAVFFLQPKNQGRFFDRTGLLVSSLEGREFTQSLANAMREDWDPDSSDAAFRSQVQALRDSCQRLLAADLQQLSPAVAEDLRTRCRKWQATLTEMLVALDNGRPVPEVRQQANQLVDRLVKILNELG